jgi:hypothetical protein
MNVESIIAALDISIAYDTVYAFAASVAAVITSVLFVLAIFIRITETQLDGLESGGKWGKAIKDIFVYGTAIAVYFAAFGLIAAFANPIYAWIEQTGSISAVTDRFNSVIAAIKLKRADQDWFDFIFGAAAKPVQFLSVAFYFLTLLAALFITLFLKIAHAFGFGVAFVWGLIALPMSVTSNLKLLRGWGYLTGFILAWPLVQGLIISLFAPMFHNAADQLVKDINTNAEWNVVSIHILFGVSHLILAAILVAAPLITALLIANAPAGGALVIPFAGAAVGALTALAKGKHRIPWNGSTSPNAPASLRTTPRPVAPSMPRSDIGGPRSSNSAPIGDTAKDVARAITERKRKQARRGAILNQRKPLKPPKY